MELSVLIATAGRPDRVAACVASLARQTLSRGRFEVLIGIDGPEAGELEAMGSSPINFTLLSFPRAGPASTRNRLLEASKGESIVFLGDNVRATPKLLETHLMQQEMLASSFPKPGTARKKRPSIVIGRVSALSPKPERVIDRFLRNTRVMLGPPLDTDEQIDAPSLDGSFRTMSSANVSMPAELAKRIGGYCRQLAHGEYDDAEFAWRADRWVHSTLMSCPDAHATTELRFDPIDCFKRVITLGYEAVTLNQLSQACTIDFFGREVVGLGEQRMAMSCITRDSFDAKRAMLAFMASGVTPLSALSSDESALRSKKLVEYFERARPWLWRTGQLAALDNVSLNSTLADFDVALREAAREASGNQRAA